MTNTKKIRECKDIVGCYTMVIDNENGNRVLGLCVECDSLIPDGKQAIQEYMCLECFNKGSK